MSDGVELGLSVVPQDLNSVHPKETANFAPRAVPRSAKAEHGIGVLMLSAGRGPRGLPGETNARLVLVSPDRRSSKWHFLQHKMVAAYMWCYSELTLSASKLLPKACLSRSK